MADTVKLCVKDGDIEALTMYLRMMQKKVDLNRKYKMSAGRRVVNIHGPEEVDVRLTTPLITAASNGYFDIVKLLLDYGAQVNLACPSTGKGEVEATDNRAVTALSVAVKVATSRQLGCCCQLTPSLNWKRDLSAAARAADTEMIEILLEQASCRGVFVSQVCCQIIHDLCAAEALPKTTR